MLNVALTGNVASGKTSVAGIWRDAGVPVVSADELARLAVEPGSDGLALVVEAFGSGVLDTAGALDRDRMRDLVFRDAGARARLEAIVHPRVRALRRAWIEDRAAEGHAVVVSEIPLLYETGSEDLFDLVVFVDAPERVRLERLVRDRELDPDEARRIMSAQGDAAGKRARADRVLDNVGGLGDLRRAALDLLAELRTLAGASPGAEPPDGADSPVGWMRLDLHLHTRGSWDCLTDPFELLERAARRGVERVAITDHNRLHEAVRLAELHPEQVIPGEEVRTAEGIDVIGLYLEAEIPKGTPARETCERIRDQGGLVYLPHPFARGKGGSGAHAERLAPLVDVVEVFNARLHPASLNGPAEAFAAEHGLLRGAGSDAHTLGEVAGAWVEVPRHANRAEALREALASGRIRGRTAPRLVHLASTWAKVHRRVFSRPR